MRTSSRRQSCEPQDRRRRCVGTNLHRDLRDFPLDGWGVYLPSIRDPAGRARAGSLLVESKDDPHNRRPSDPMGWRSRRGFFRAQPGLFRSVSEPNQTSAVRNSATQSAYEKISLVYRDLRRVGSQWVLPRHEISQRRDRHHDDDVSHVDVADGCGSDDFFVDQLHALFLVVFHDECQSKSEHEHEQLDLQPVLGQRAEQLGFE